VAPEVIDGGDRSATRAAEILRAGGLVAIPTETVYGLAADASSPEAVGRVFRAKGRPADHPLIVHVESAERLPGWAGSIPEEASILAEAFWPGPLTIVLPRHPSVPLAVTGGRESVAVRVPSHPVALRVLEAFGGGLAAPSANRFGRISPTTAADVVADLGSEVDLVVDGGPCAVGVESTVVEISAPGPGTAGPGTMGRDADAAPSRRRPTVTILRPGGVSAEQLEDVLGSRVNRTATGPARAPGMLASHYAPRTPVELCDRDEARERVRALSASGRRVGLISPERAPDCGAAAAWDAGSDVGVFAASLYRWLREADASSLDVLVAVAPEPEGIGSAVRDRLERAASR
jgi:L-threonylcarbamoyladenylate synthase